MHHNNEIDIIDLFFKLLRVIRKNMWLITSFVILGVGLSIYKSYKVDDYYRVSFLTMNNIVQKKVCSNILNSISDELDDANYDLLSKSMGLDISEVSKVKSLDILEIDSNIVECNLEVYDRLVVDKFYEGIVTFMDNTPYIKKEIELKNKQNKELLLKIEEEISYLTSVKSMVKQTNSSNQNLFVYVSDLQSLISKNLMDMYKEKNDIEKKILDNKHALLRITDYTIDNTPSNKRFYKIILGAAFGFIFGLVVVVFKHILCVYNRKYAQ